MLVEPAGSRWSSPAATGLADIIHWSAAAIDARLLGARVDAAAVVPFVAPRTRWFYWELHFSEKRPARVDFLHRPSLRLQAIDPGFLSPDPILRDLVDWYAGGDTAVHCHDTAWLELDGPLASRRNVQQGVSVCLEPDIGNRSSAPRSGPPISTLLDAFSRLQRACGCEPRGADVLTEVHRALGGVGGSLRHLSVMRGRAGSPAKVYAALPKGRLPELLAAIAWPGAVGAALQLADLACAESQRINVDLSFDDALIPRIAYEHFFDPSPAQDPLRRGATALATALGLLTQEQAQALGRWVGSFRVSSGNTFETQVTRWFDLKFVLSPQGLEFKAYLGFRICDD